jgi:hypothetical protein
MPSKFHLVLTFKFQNSFFKFQFIRLIIDLLKFFLCFKLNHCLLLCFSMSSLIYLVGKLWRKGTYSTEDGNSSA